MTDQAIFNEQAWLYDLIYASKDYRGDAAAVKRLISKHKRSEGSKLLEVACGTGRHIQFLKDDFDVLATDVNRAMLSVARRNIKGVKFAQADMTNLNLGKSFDVILCLSRSIGYVRTYTKLKKTLNGFAQHLAPGGVLIVEPWLTRSEYMVGAPILTTYSDDSIKIVRANVSKARGNVSHLDFHYLVAERDKDVRYFTDHHELGMFEPARVLDLMKRSGLQAQFLKKGLKGPRGVYVGVRR